ncbi:MAG: hypothetical protein KAT68_15720 [Bacteroidales bacterium]|nr:hypothetical protein [Bacteroidales bacterium]
MNEENYTKNTIIPLLKKMGYMEVTYNHGIREFGKDIIFSEFDKFGNKKYYAAQIKDDDISGSNKGDIHDLISHIRNTFNIKFPDLITRTEVKISEYFVIISGKFIGNAKELLLNFEELQKYKHRIHYYEGRHISDFIKRNFQDFNDTIIALINELNRNIQLATAIEEFLIPTGRVFIKYLNFNLQVLIDKLNIIEDRIDLKKSLEHFQLLINKNNHILNYMPIVKPIKGDEFELSELLKDRLKIIQLANDLIKKLKKELI